MANYSNKLDSLKKTLAKKDKQIHNLQENIKMLNARRMAVQEELTKAKSTLAKLQKTSMAEIAQEYLGVYLKWITEQHGTEQIDEVTGEALGKMFAFTFQEQNDNVFRMMPIQDEEGRLSMVCSSAYPIEEGEEDEEKK